ncbi:MAG: IS66 family transposase zinc-finger binding domain-containing protein, partial [Magnetococcales bacterium]|nr:IS66 family transposase zinc-finger binding domain-containing protein [Magnetococcales bacterium]
MRENTEIDVNALLLENARLKAENLAQREMIVRLQEQIAVLMQKVALLEERLRQNSNNSSKPPSQDPPSMKRPGKPSTGRPRGGQPGHKGTSRQMLPPEQVDRTVEVKPEVCHGCGGRLEGEDAHPGRHQVAEIPEIRPLVTEYRIHELVCPCCGERTIGRLPEGVPTGAFG